jgi:integrase
LKTQFEGIEADGRQGDTLRAALGCAVDDEVISRNPVSKVRLATRRAPKSRRKPQAWTVEDARWFLESAWHAGEALYPAFVLVLVLGLRKGEVLGLAWDQIDFDAGEVYIGEQLQRVGRQLLRREVKTETSEAPLPLPDLCAAALLIRRAQQEADRARAGDRWTETGLVFTTRYGTPIEPRNFNRSFDRCVKAARVPRITVHGTRKTCASLLAALDVHPRGDAHPAAQQDRRHDGDLHRGSPRRHPRRAPQARRLARVTPLLPFAAAREARRPVPSFGTGR